MTGAGSCYLAVDPGREKCGLAVVGQGGEPLCLRAAAADAFTAEFLSLYQKYRPAQILLGAGTGSPRFHVLLKSLLPGRPILLVNERDTTLEARRIYWRCNPPRGWKKYLPAGLRTPDGPLDAYAALAIARLWIESRETCRANPENMPDSGQ
ncbi:MAG: hypothetical protein LBP78_02030 [Acidaminococcales bacterium]|jgi:RNase H-fold protein (predicted Holliday junction resolvase)|nr:hypothetical protein [Acidaminococcales bacterium]